MTEENIRIIVHDDGRIEFERMISKEILAWRRLEQILGELVDDLAEQQRLLNTMNHR